MILLDRRCVAHGRRRRPWPPPRLPPAPRPCRPAASWRAGLAADLARRAGSRGRAARSASAGRDGCRARRRRRAGPSAGRRRDRSSRTSATFIRSMRRKSRMSSLPSRFRRKAGQRRAPSSSPSAMPSSSRRAPRQQRLRGCRRSGSAGRAASIQAWAVGRRSRRAGARHRRHPAPAAARRATAPRRRRPARRRGRGRAARGRSARTTSGCRRLSRCASGETRKPGANSTVRARAAELRVGLEHQHLAAGLGRAVRRDQAVVAAADDDGVK